MLADDIDDVIGLLNATKLNPCRKLAYLLCRVDVEAWPVVFVEGTQAEHFAAFAFERKVLAYDIDNVIGLLNARN